MTDPKTVRTATTTAELADLAQLGQLVGLFDVPIDVYHAGPGVSSSGLKELLKSPAHFRTSLEQDQEDSAALRFGRLVHMRILEPHVYAAKTIVYRDAKTAHPGNGNIKEIKAARQVFEDDFAQESHGKDVLSRGEADKVEAMAKACEANKLAASILGNGVAEISVYWVDVETGVLCKARADLLRGDAIFDLKTCYSAQAKEFQKAVVGYRYDLSAAFYMDGFATVTPIKNFAWLAVEKTAPYVMGFYACDHELLNAGRADYQKALRVFAECEKSGQWPGLPMEFINLSMTGI
jgi:exodeoxyribonuclease VIII